MPAIMHDHLTALLDAGFEVTLERAHVPGEPDERRYWAHVCLGEGTPITAEGKTPAEAIWAASPLHGDDEPMPPIMDLIAETSDGFRDVLGVFREEVNVARKVAAADRAIDEIHDEMDIITERVAALEADRRDMTILIGVVGDLYRRVFPDGHLDDVPAESRVEGDEPAAGEQVQGAGDGRPVDA